jgi:hypothetical protein
METGKNINVKYATLLKIMHAVNAAEGKRSYTT